MIISPFFEGDKPTPQQEEIISNLTDAMVVSAGAGTGKTWTLTKRYINKLIHGAMPEQIVAITFTKKAAQEMKGRIRQSIAQVESSSTNEEEKKLWRKKKMNLDYAMISTIHGFCFELIKEYPLQAGIDPTVSILEESEAGWLKQESIDRLIDALLVEQNASLLHLFTEFGSLPAVKHTIIQVGELLHIYGHNIEEDNILSAVFGETEANLVKVSEGLIARSKDFCQQISDGITETTALFEQKGKGIPEVYASFYKKWDDYVASMFNWTPFIDELSDFDAILTELKPSFGVTGGNDLKPFRNLVKEAFEFWATAGIAATYPQTVRALLELGSVYQKQYKEAKLRGKTLDFNDLEQIALSLSESPEVQNDFRHSIKYVMLDENQDTNPLQMKLINNLIGNGKETVLFVVGDPKQSIYRFRGAEVAGFVRLQRHLKAQSLSRNFRTFHPIIHFINDLFGSKESGFIGVMNPAPDSPEYVVNYEELEAFRISDDTCHIEWLMDCVEKDDRDEMLYPFNHEDSYTARKEAENVASRIKQIVEAQLPIVEKNSDGHKRKVPATYDDFAILFFTRTHQEKYEQELQKRNIPYQVVGGRFFWQQQEVRDVTNYLKLIVKPEDEIGLASFLRSPFGLINDETLIALSRQGGIVNSFYNVSNCPSEVTAEQWERVLQLRKEVVTLQNQVGLESCYNIMKQIMKESHFLPHLLCLPSGEQKAANVEKWLETIRLAEEAQNLSPFQLIHYIGMLAEEESHEQAEVVIGEGRGVTLMTVHASKGLEFPIVVIPKLQGGAGSGGSSRLYYEPDKGLILHYTGEENKKIDGVYIQSFKEEDTRREIEEEKRLLYVAMTRARDYLILSSLKERAKKPIPEKEDTTLYWLLRYISIDALCYSDVVDGYREQLQEGEHFKQILISNVIINIIPNLPEEQVIVGEETEEQKETIALPEEMLVNETIASTVSFSSYSFSMLNEFKSCQRKFYFKRVAGIPDTMPFEEEPSVERVFLGAEREIAATVEHVSERGTLTAAALGSVVHRGCELLASGLSVRTAAERAIVENGRSSDEVETVIPYLVNYEASGYLRNNAETEVRFQVRVGEKSIVGVIDSLISHDDGTYTIVDFKTNKLTGEKTLDELVGIYEQQMLLYAWALHSITGKTVREAVLLFLDHDLNQAVHLDLMKSESTVKSIIQVIGEVEKRSSIDSFDKNIGTQCAFCSYKQICGLFE